MPQDKKMQAPDWALDNGAVGAVVSGQHGDPFAVLGLHEAGSNFIARAFVHDAETLTAYTLKGKSIGTLTRRHSDGLFEGEVLLKKRQPIKYHATRGGDEWWVIDAYSFSPVLGPMDDYYISEGTHLRLFDKLGAHLMEFEESIMLASTIFVSPTFLNTLPKRLLVKGVR